jgi:hypothetical protein
MPSVARYESRWTPVPIHLCAQDEERYAEALRKADYKRSDLHLAGIKACASSQSERRINLTTTEPEGILFS